MAGHEGPEGVDKVSFYSFFSLGTRNGWVVNATPQSLYPHKRDPVRIVQEAEWAPGPVQTGMANIAPTDIRSPDLRACSVTLYRLRCREPQNADSNSG